MDSTHRPVDTTTAVAKGSYTFITPTGTELAKAKVGEARPHGAWEGWTIAPVEVSQSFTVEVPRQESATIKVSGSPDFAWDMTVKTLPNAHGLDGELVYTQSPRVIANTELSMELAYVPIGGEEEAVLEDELPEGIHEVLPADAFEDPWVCLLYTSDAADDAPRV